MSAVVVDETDEFDDFDDDVGDWDDDVEELNEMDKIMEKSQKSVKSKNQDNSCWKCVKCKSINNIQLTMEKYSMQCSGCGNTSYIPDVTPIIVSKDWNVHALDYLIQNQIVIKVWICKGCTFQNTFRNVNDQYICSMCGCNKMAEIKYVSNQQTDAPNLEEIGDDVSDKNTPNKSESKQETKNKIKINDLSIFDDEFKPIRFRTINMPGSEDMDNDSDKGDPFVTNGAEWIGSYKNPMIGSHYHQLMRLGHICEFLNSKRIIKYSKYYSYYPINTNHCKMQKKNVLQTSAKEYTQILYLLVQGFCKNIAIYDDIGISIPIVILRLVLDKIGYFVELENGNHNDIVEKWDHIHSPVVTGVDNEGGCIAARTMDGDASHGVRFGTYIAKRNECGNNNKYIWNVRTPINMEDIDRHIPIVIGVVNADKVSAIYAKLGRGLYSFSIRDLGWGIYGASGKKDKYEQYCVPFESGDIVSVILDLYDKEKGYLSYAINGYDCGVAYVVEYSKCDTFRLCVALKESLTNAQIVKFQIV